MKGDHVFITASYAYCGKHLVSVTYYHHECDFARWASSTPRRSLGSGGVGRQESALWASEVLKKYPILTV